MPELPEVEVTLRGIAPQLTGRTLTGVAVREPRLRWRVQDSAEISTVTAVTDFDKTGKKTAVSFIADSSTATVDSLRAFPDTAQANGSSTITLQAIIRDANGNLVNQAQVMFTATGGAKLSSSLANTTADGKVSVELTHTTAGNSTVTATTAFDKTGKNTAVTFVADATTASIASLTATPPSGVKADGKSTSTVTVTVKDANGNTVKDELVTFSITGKARLSQPSVKTDGNGNAAINVTNTAAERSIITAVTAYDTRGKQAAVSFIGDVATAKIESFTASRVDDVVANGKESSVLQATVKDAQGNLVSGANVIFNMTKGNGKLSQTSVISVNGIASVKLASRTAGSSIVNALTDFDKTGKIVSVSFIADADTAKVASFTASRTEGVKANGTDSSLLSATVKDANGNLVNGVKVSFTTSASHHGQLSQRSATTVNGIATVQLTSLSASTTLVTAALMNSVLKLEVSFIPDATTAKIYSFTSPFSNTNVNSITANGKNYAELVAMVSDAQGNLVSGVTVFFRVQTGQGRVRASAITVGGLATVKITSLIAGINTVSATTENDLSGKMVSVRFRADSFTPKIASLTASRTAEVKANEKDWSSLRAAVTDANGNTLSNAQVFFVVKGNARTSSPSARTDSDGIATMPLISLTADTSTVTAYTEFDKTGKQVSVSFIADEATAQIDSLIASPPSGTKANGTDSAELTATVKDTNGNLLSGTKVYFILTGNATLSKASAVTSKEGKAVVTLSSKLARENVIVAVTDFDKKGKQVSVSFIANKSTAKVTGVSALPANAVLANGKALSTITAMVLDANNNPVNDVKVIFSVSGKAELNQLAALTDSNGYATVTLTSNAAGRSVVTARTDIVKDGQSASVNFIADIATAKVASLTASPAMGVPADGKTVSTLTAVVKDAKDNPVKDVAVTFKATGSVTWGEITPKTDANGIATAKLTSTVEGSNTVTITTGNDKTGKSAKVSFVAGAISASNSTLQIGNSSILQADGKSTLTITLTAKDRYGNKITGANISFKVSNFDDANISAVTEKKGIYTATLTSGNKASLGSITVWQNDIQVKDMSADVGQYSPRLTLVVN